MLDSEADREVAGVTFEFDINNTLKKHVPPKISPEKKTKNMKDNIIQ